MNQLEWEAHNKQLKIDKLLYSIQGSKDRGYISSTAVGQTVINQFLIHIEEELIDLSMRKTRGMGGKYAQVLRDAAVFSNGYGNMKDDYRRVAYIGLLTTLDLLFHQKKKKSYVSHIASKIGEELESEQQLNLFRKTDAGLEHLQHTDHHSKRKRIQLIKRTLAQQQRDWEPWGTKTRVQIGLRVLKAIVRVMDNYIVYKSLKTGSRSILYLTPTDELYEFLAEHNQYLIGKLRSSVPCIEKPIEWSADDRGNISGGFHSVEYSSVHPFVRTKTKDQREYVCSSTPTAHIKCVNSLQDVTWAINTDVLELLKVCSVDNLFPGVIPTTQKKELTERPPDDHPMRKEWGKESYDIIKWNKKNIQALLRFQNVISIANFLESKSFWFVYNSDFRGRIYCCSSHLNPQGPDYVRALLRFSKGKPLGKSGYKWLAVHGANCYGYNKVAYIDRYQWVMDNLDGILQVATQPNSSAGMRLLREAKQPFQFYAFCREWKRVCESKVPQEVESYLPCTLDGSCNGFQHYSALLCDESGAAFVNLISSKLPSDLYGIITEELNRRASRDIENTLGTQVYDRDLVKSVVMPLPYGITIRGASLAIQQQLDTQDWDLIRALTTEILDITDHFITSYKELTVWLKQCSDLFAQADTPAHWISPVGFPVMQPYTLFKEESVKTDFFGSKTIYYRDKPQGVMRSKSSAGISPNFIHSMDASHLVLSVNKASSENIDTITCIHDCIGTYAADTHRLKEIINESFCELYTPDVLEGIKKQWSDIIQPSQLPDYGSYDITEVLASSYFFH